ncbi:hypothetical protein F8388_019118 [Cannabis sativa]|uniref:Uncharacterized protein n=1 Tax=Cannabis sativa TaxID=3483 RepID=A0A7J6FCI3_CANSA|nr:hypothetical protein F8388_019118 [Cannabis sativa]
MGNDYLLAFGGIKDNQKSHTKKVSGVVGLKEGTFGVWTSCLVTLCCMLCMYSVVGSDESSNIKSSYYTLSQ